MEGELLAVVEVDKADRVVCQAAGCGHGVYRRIHLVRHGDGSLEVYGSDCFGRLFGHLANSSKRRLSKRCARLRKGVESRRNVADRRRLQ